MRNTHWRPQAGNCAFCSINYTVYSKLEETEEDTAFFLEKVITGKEQSCQHIGLNFKYGYD